MDFLIFVKKMLETVIFLIEGGMSFQMLGPCTLISLRP